MTVSSQQWDPLELLTAIPPGLQLLPPLLHLTLVLGHLLEPLLLVLELLEPLFLLLPDALALQLVGAADGDVARLVVGEQLLEGDLDEPARGVVDDHDGRHGDLELVREGDELHLLVELGDELGRAAEGDGRHTHNAVEHALVLGKCLTEGAALVVDGEGADLLDELKEVHGAVEERGGKLGLEIDDFGAAYGEGMLVYNCMSLSAMRGRGLTARAYRRTWRCK